MDQRRTRKCAKILSISATKYSCYIPCIFNCLLFLKECFFFNICHSCTISLYRLCLQGYFVLLQRTRRLTRSSASPSAAAPEPALANGLHSWSSSCWQLKLSRSSGRIIKTAKEVHISGHFICITTFSLVAIYGHNV